MVAVLRRFGLLVALVVLAAVGILILILGPEYLNLQKAEDAEAFRDLLPGSATGRYVGAALVDMAFAVFYGAAALAFAPRFIICRLGAWFVVAGAMFDEAENVIVLQGVLDEDALTDERVDLMGAFGMWKYGSLGVGLLLVLVGFFWSRHGGDRTNSPRS